MAVGARRLLLPFVVQAADLVLYGRVTRKALYLVLRHVILVEELRRVLRLKDLPLVMTLKTGKLRDMAVT